VSYTIYRETPETGRMHWGERPKKASACSYAGTLVEMYRMGGPLYREHDPVIHVQVVEDRTGKLVFSWDSPAVR
jgi:hypothetical protein